LADFCIATIQGALLMGKVSRDSRPAEAAVQEALAHLKRYATTPKRPKKGKLRKWAPYGNPRDHREARASFECAGGVAFV